MNNHFKYIFAKIKSKLRHGDKEVINNHFRSIGMQIGGGVTICCDIAPSEPFLVSIGRNTTISSDVLFCTHDNSISKIYNNLPDIFGLIKIGEGCFLGQRSQILYGVTLADNIIVAAGSVVTHSFQEEGVIIGGNPAKIIGKFPTLLKNTKKKQ